MSDHRPSYAQAPARRHPPPAARRLLPPRVAVAVLLVVLTVSSACTGTRPTTPTPSRKPIESGIASWYGGEFHGRRTASGERFDTHQLTAAHRTLAFGTVVEVHDLDNDRRVRVRINDRGPFAHRRIIDLSYAAAEQLGMVGPGTARVELTVVAPGPDELPPQSRYTVQIAAFTEPERAEALYSRVAPDYPDAAVRSDGTWHRVQVGEFDQRSPAERLRRELARLGYTALVVTLQ